METLESPVAASFDWLALAGALIPVAALIWAIYAFYSSRRADRQDAMRSKRVEYYVEYLNILGRPELSGATIEIEDFSKGMASISHIHSLLLLTAPNTVIDASRTVLVEFMASRLDRVGPTASLPDLSSIDSEKNLAANFVAFSLSEAGKSHRARAANFAAAHQNLVREMRRDVMSKIDGQTELHAGAFGEAGTV